MRQRVKTIVEQSARLKQESAASEQEVAKQEVSQQEVTEEVSPVEAKEGEVVKE